jgi:S-disulfanyl-L-cysteine oxidoreductase SoxD
MCNWREWAAAFALLAAGSALAQPSPFPGVGRGATPKEVAAWDIDVRPDFKGLPRGEGSVAKGMEVWESKCSSCHGIFGENNEVFSPVIGGTTKDDIKTGRVARLNDAGYPGRTTLMKLSTLSTLWDYINRAMPWAQPKSLSTEEVYAVTAYLLNMGGVVPDDFTLSDRNMAQAQQWLPNRNGTTTDHGLWPGRSLGHRKPDVTATACMTNCAGEPQLASFLPDFARDSHGNLAEQNRAVGAQRGADTSRPAAAAPLTAPLLVPAKAAGEGAAAALGLAQKHTCMACHAFEGKLVGPSFRDVAKKYAARPDAAAYLAGKIKAGGSGVWGAIPMPMQALGEADAHTIAQWLTEGAKR